MIGVILWSDKQERKAVVWCEDQGDLAFLGCGSTQYDNLGQLAEGDILEFDIEIDGDLRCVNNPILLTGYESGDVAVGLIDNTQVAETHLGKVLAFPSPTPANVASDLPAEIAV